MVSKNCNIFDVLNVFQYFSYQNQISKYPVLTSVTANSLHIIGGERHTEGDMVNSARAVHTEQVKSVPPIKVEYKGTSTLIPHHPPASCVAGEVDRIRNLFIVLSQSSTHFQHPQHQSEDSISQCRSLDRRK